MITKIIPAYLSESSTTIRLTADDIADILSKCNAHQLDLVFEELKKITDYLGSDRKNIVVDAMKKYLK